jgi:PAS domain S-box-containing protein
LPNAVLNAIEKCRLENERENYVREIIGQDMMFKRAEKIAHFGIWESDLVTGIVKWSDEVYELFGYTKNEIEPSLEYVLKALHPDDVVATKNLIEDAIRYKNSLNIDYRSICPGNLVKYLNSVLFIHRDASGKAIKITGFKQDITEEKEAKIERDKMMADVMKRNEELEQFSYIVSHNLRAPLANIIGLVNMLKTEEKENGMQEKIVNSIDISVNKLDNVIHDLNHILNVRGSIDDEKETVSFTQLVNDIKEMISSTIEQEKAEIIIDFSEIDEMHTLKSYIHSIFYNLIINGIAFHQPDLPPVIKITSHKVKDKISLLFEDKGIGMDLAKVGKKIFKLYNGLNAKGKGMGLFMIKNQVEELNGKVFVSSKVNKGTEFRIEFEE